VHTCIWPPLLLLFALLRYISPKFEWNSMWICCKLGRQKDGSLPPNYGGFCTPVRKMIKVAVAKLAYLHLFARLLANGMRKFVNLATSEMESFRSRYSEAFPQIGTQNRTQHLLPSPHSINHLISDDKHALAKII